MNENTKVYSDGVDPNDTLTCKECGHTKNFKVFRRKPGDITRYWRHCLDCVARAARNRRGKSEEWDRRPKGEWYSTKRATTTPSMMDIAWAAGLIEGEGDFPKSYRSGIRVKQVNPEPVEKLLSLFGGSLKYRPRHVYHKDGTRTHIWEWAVSGSRAMGVALTIFQFMSSKRKSQIMVSLGVAC